MSAPLGLDEMLSADPGRFTDQMCSPELLKRIDDTPLDEEVVECPAVIDGVPGDYAAAKHRKPLMERVKAETTRVKAATSQPMSPLEEEATKVRQGGVGLERQLWGLLYGIVRDRLAAKAAGVATLGEDAGPGLRALHAWRTEAALSEEIQLALIDCDLGFDLSVKPSTPEQRIEAIVKTAELKSQRGVIGVQLQVSVHEEGAPLPPPVYGVFSGARVIRSHPAKTNWHIGTKGRMLSPKPTDSQLSQLVHTCSTHDGYQVIAVAVDRKAPASVIMSPRTHKEHAP